VSELPAPPDAPDPDVAETVEAPGAAGAIPSFVLVDVASVSFAMPSPSPVVFLRESGDPYRGLEFPVGLPEAQSIALALEHESPLRPGAHELLVGVLTAAGCDVIAVRIVDHRDGVLRAELDLVTPRGHEVLDCRPSDGLAIALRQLPPAPILCDERLLD